MYSSNDQITKVCSAIHIKLMFLQNINLGLINKITINQIQEKNQMIVYYFIIIFSIKIVLSYIFLRKSNIFSCACLISVFKIISTNFWRLHWEIITSHLFHSRMNFSNLLWPNFSYYNFIKRSLGCC
jgi:hypothetical protein